MNNEKFVFAQTQLDITRSTFNLSHGWKGTLKSADLIPIQCIEVLPGDTFEEKSALVLRGLTPIAPVMDNAYIDINYYYVPSRIIAPWNGDDWEEIQGVNKSGAWAPNTEKYIKKRTLPSGQKILSQSLGDYLGIPIGTTLNNTAINPYPFIGYYLIYDYYFRDQNTQKPILTTKETSVLQLLSLADNGLQRSNKFHDLFTSCLPAPQKGNSVSLPLGIEAPIASGSSFYHLDALGNTPGIKLVFDRNGAKGINYNIYGFSETAGSDTSELVGDANIMPTSPAPDRRTIEATNLVADLSSATAATINQLRQAFAIQRQLEKDARGGTRYYEVIKSNFNLSIPESVIQYPEYITGKRIPINITQVLQTSQTDSTNNSALGQTGAFSNTAGLTDGYIKSFKEWGYLYAIATIRTEQTYSQGLPKMFQRYRRFDFYLPTFANLGEQPIYKNELYFDDTNTTNESVFGYQEAWAHYRYQPTTIHGSLAPNAKDKSFTAWTYTNNFTTAPTLNANFMTQTAGNVAQTLVYENTNQQYILDIWHNIKATRAIPIFSIPGLIDHH